MFPNYPLPACRTTKNNSFSIVPAKVTPYGLLLEITQKNPKKDN